MGKKKDEPKIIQFEDIPKKYLSAPVADEYQPELAELYRRKAKQSGFATQKMNSSSEKFFRLYFYQGLSQGDRTLLHQEYLETQSRRYICTSLVIITSIGAYGLIGLSVRYNPFKIIRLSMSGLCGYASYKTYKNYSTYLLETATEPFYEKYAIR